MNPRWIALLALLALSTGGSPVSAQTNVPLCNNAGFLATQHAHANHAEVTLCGTVARLRKPRRTRSGMHRLFFVDTGHRNRVEIDANLDVMGDFPIENGEPIVVRGEYYYDRNGRDGVHWTHHTDRGPHPAGFITLAGKTYS